MVRADPGRGSRGATGPDGDGPGRAAGAPALGSAGLHLAAPDLPGLGLAAPRLVATDLDGTLLGPDGTVSTRTSAALRAAHEAGLDVLFVTARPPRWAVELAEHVAGHGAVICANGALVLDVATRATLAEHGMPPALVGQVAAALRDAMGGPGRVRLATESVDGFAYEHGFRSTHPVPPGSPSAARIEDVLTGSTLKILVRTSTPGAVPLADEVTAAVGTLAIAADSGAVGLGEISGPGVTKAATLARWAGARGVAAHEVWAVGDAPNDLPMLAWAGASFAVANAHPVVLAAADHALPSNGDDGVAHLLEHALARVRELG